MQINNLSKKYGKNTILNYINYNIEHKCTVILGDNGSGKTTLFKILGGIIKKYDGSIDIKNDSSLLLDDDNLFKYKNGIENIEYFLNELEREKAKKYVDYFLMNDYIGNKVKTYSSGMKKKLSLVISISKDKKNLLLDEPTNYLDIKSVDLLKELLIELKKEKNIIISSHDVAILDDNLIDEILLLKNHSIKKIDKNLFDFDYYKVKTINKIDEISYDYHIENDYYIFKVRKTDFLNFSFALEKYVIKEMIPIDYFDPIYLEDLYEKDN